MMINSAASVFEAGKCVDKNTKKHIKLGLNFIIWEMKISYIPHIFGAKVFTFKYICLIVNISYDPMRLNFLAFSVNH